MIRASYLGTVPYQQALDRQRALRERVKADNEQGYILLLEHPRIITIGRNEDERKGLRVSPERLITEDIEIVRTDRGGQWTYHGPGQLVVYFILNLKKRRIALKRFVTQLEEVMIRFLSEFHIAGERNPDRPGVWVGGQKIGFIGINIKTGITTHGLAININNDPTPFTYIVPCGLEHGQVTSIREITGSQASMQTCTDRMIGCLAKVFNEPIESLSEDELNGLLEEEKP